MKSKANDCRGCRDCVNCGLKAEYDVLVCDECGDIFDELAEYDGEELCPDCLWARMEKVKVYT